MDALKIFWDIALASHSDPEVTDKWWAIVKSRYTADVRKYHSEVYLAKLFELYKTYETVFQCKQSLVLAIFFHKLEYNPTLSEAEDHNLKEFNKFAEEIKLEAKDKDLAARTRCLLEACASNLTEEHMQQGATGSEDRHYLLDITMCAMGGKPSDYLTYTEGIEKECSCMTKVAYAQLRLKVLQSLLLIPNVYATKEFQEKYEKQARENIKNEIKTLSSSKK